MRNSNPQLNKARPTGKMQKFRRWCCDYALKGGSKCPLRCTWTCMCRKLVTNQLRRRGVDVLTTNEDGASKREDEDLLISVL